MGVKCNPEFLQSKNMCYGSKLSEVTDGVLKKWMNLG
jgi:hypothetical protein